MSNWTLVTGQEVSHVDTTGGTNQIAVSLPVNATAGNVVCIGMQWFDGTGVAPTFSSIQDENGKTYTVSPNSPVPDTAAATGNVFLAYCIVPAGAGKTITATSSKNFTIAAIHAEEFNLSVGSIAFDSDAVSSDGASGSTITTPTVTVSSSDDLTYAFASSETGVTSADSPWTGEGSSDTNGNWAEWILGASSSTAVAFHNNGSVRYACAAMSFKAAGGGGGPTVAQEMPAIYQEHIGSVMIGRRYV